MKVDEMDGECTKQDIFILVCLHNFRRKIGRKGFGCPKNCRGQCLRIAINAVSRLYEVFVQETPGSKPMMDLVRVVHALSRQFKTTRRWRGLAEDNEEDKRSLRNTKTECCLSAYLITRHFPDVVHTYNCKVKHPEKLIMKKVAVPVLN
jgi:hypothetical protein